MVKYFKNQGWIVAVVHFHDRSQKDFDYQAMALRCDFLRVFCPREHELAARSSCRIDDWCPLRFVELVSETIDQLNPDVVIIQFVFFSRCLLPIQGKKRPLKVIDADNVFTDRTKNYVERGFSYSWFSTDEEQERTGLARSDILLAIQERECEKIKIMMPDKPVLLVPHAHEVQPYSVPAGHNLLFVGAANQENASGLKKFIKYALPEIKLSFPRVNLVVAGRVCELLEEFSEKVSFLGVVEDIDQLYKAASIVLNTTEIGTGLKIKTVEALCHGRCLVTTAAGIQGLESYTGIYHLAHTPLDFAEIIVCLLQNPKQLLNTGRDAALFAKNYFDPSSVMKTLEDNLIKALQESS